MKKFNYFPLVGILTSKGKIEDTFRGDLSVFKSIQKELMRIGGLSFIFTTEGVNENDVSGYIFYETLEKWGKIAFPFPDIIYNKVSSRNEEKNTPFLTLFDSYKQGNKPFFNPSFFDKWDIYQALSKSNHLLPYLPKTWIYTNMNDLLYKLNTYHSLYVKPVNGHKGKGIYKLSFDGLYYFIHRKHNRMKYFHADFAHDVGTLLKEGQYLLQMDIHTDKIDDCKYDLRILCLYNNESHKISGIGVRKAAENSIITHVPNGGDIVSLQYVKHKYSTRHLNWLVETVGDELTKEFGFIGEFSVDVGLSPEGKPYIFEVNSKPMIFDEIDIQKKRISQLVEVFKDLANSTNNSMKDF
jgi:glutathione synthase/RimK-type ligase-like ATP-grasp enzyme